MFGELANRLKSAGLGVTIEELWDIFWLAERLPTNEGHSYAGEVRRREDDNKRTEATLDRQDGATVRHTALGRRGPSPKQGGGDPVNLYPAKQTGTIRASILRVPGVAATEHPEDMRRALQPFARRKRSRWRITLDEDETAASAAGHRYLVAYLPLQCVNTGSI